ncbi:MAG: 3-hydroxyacyl-CoA dehydrogenase family protein [Zavarzinella sp.]
MLQDSIRSPWADAETIPTYMGVRTPADEILANYLSEGYQLVAEGFAPSEVDKICLKSGFRFGPLTFMDGIGFETIARWITRRAEHWQTDVINLTFKRIFASFGSNVPENEGFYRRTWLGKRDNHVLRMLVWRDFLPYSRPYYRQGSDLDHQHVLRRIQFRLMNLAGNLLADDFYGTPEQIDAQCRLLLGTQTGTWAPFTMIDELGAMNVAEELQLMSSRYGRRFQVSDELYRRAEANEPFFPTVGVPQNIRTAA